MNFDPEVCRANYPFPFYLVNASHNNPGTATAIVLAARMGKRNLKKHKGCEKIGQAKT